jgi:hypothetical protein
VEEDLGECDFIFLGVSAVFIDAGDNEGLFGWFEKFPSLGGKVDDDEPPCEADCNGDSAFNYEDP